MIITSSGIIMLLVVICLIDSIPGSQAFAKFYESHDDLENARTKEHKQYIHAYNEYT